MKKVLAMVMTVAMLLTCMFVMPAMADELPENVALAIVNPSFELDEPGKTITGWTKGYEEAEGAVTWEVKGGTGVTEGEKMIGIGGSNGGNKWLSQEVAIPADLAPNMASYKWTFKDWNTYCTYLKLKVYGAEGTDPVVMEFNDFDLRASAVHESVLDVTAAMTAVANPTKVEISIGAHNNGGTYDQISLTGFLTTASIVTNGGLEEVNEDGAVVDWNIGTTGGAPAYPVSSHVVDEETNNSYVVVAQEKNDEGGNTGKAGVLGREMMIEDNAKYLLSVKYKAIATTDAYVKFSVIPDGWLAVVDETLPVSDAEATSLEEAEWATFERIFAIKEYGGVDEVKVDLAFRAHPWGTAGAWYDDIKIYKLEGETGTNLLPCGAFEYNSPGESNIIGWEQTNPDGALAVIGGAKGVDGSQAVGSDSGYSGLRASFSAAPLRKLDEATLSFAFGYNGGGGMPSINVTTRYVDGTTSTIKNVAYSTHFAKGNYENPTADDTWNIPGWGMQNYTLDVSDALKSNADGSLIDTITVDFNGGNCGGWWDNVVLTAGRALPKLNPEGDFITNGSFEYANEGTTITDQAVMAATGWTQIGTANQMTWRTLTGAYLIPADDGGNWIAYGKSGAAIQQSITLDTNSDYFKNHEKYRWTLKFSAYNAGAQPAVKVVVKAYDGEEEAVTEFIGGKDFIGTKTWTMEDYTLDISNGMDGFAKPVSKYDIQLVVTGSEGGFEAVSLKAEYDETKKYPTLPINIPFVNPSFELDEAGTAIADGGEITGWTCGSATAGWRVTEATTAGGGGAYAPSHGSKVLVADATCAFDNYIAQEIEIPADADYYANMNDYTWKLSLSTYYILAVEITAYNSDKSNSATTLYSSFDGRRWDSYSWEWDISDALAKVGKARYIEFKFRGNGNNGDTQPTMLDNIKFTCLKKDAADDTTASIIENGNFETFDENEVAANWEATYPDNPEMNMVFKDADISLGGFGGAYVANGEVEGALASGSIYQTMNVEAGKYYKFTMTYKAADEAAIVEVVGADGTKMLSQIYDNTATTYGDWSTAAWIKVSQLFKATETGEVKLVLGCVANRDGAYFDNVIVSEYEVNENNLYTRKNLLVNGSFEEDAIGAVGFIGWTIENTYTPASITIEEARARHGKKVMRHKGDIISQTVEITDYDAVNGQNYGYVLDFSYGSYNGGGQPVMVDVTFEDETANVSATFNPLRVNRVDEEGKAYFIKTDEFGNQMQDEEGNFIYEETTVDRTTQFPHVVLAPTPENVSIDLSFLTQSTTSPVKSIKITLPMVGTEAYLDDFRLYAKDVNYVDITDKDGNLVVGIPTEEGMTLLANAEYYGDAETVKLVFAVYNVIGEDTLELVDMDIKAIGEDGTFESAMLGGLTLTEGENVLKAFIMEGSMLNAIEKYEVK